MATLKTQDIVQDFLNQEQFGQNFVYVKMYETFAVYGGGHYKIMDRDDLQKQIWQFINTYYPTKNISSSMIEDVYRQMKYACHRIIPDLDAPYIAFTDKLLNLETFEYEEFSPEKYVLHQLPFESEKLTTPTPNFNKFLATSIVKEDNVQEQDNDLTTLLQEAAGYYLVPNLNGAVAFFLIGEGANGKSRFADVLQLIIGQQYVSAMSIESLTMDKFASVNLVGKKLNVCAEEESKFLRMDRFKALISGDTTMAERKFGESFRFRPKTKYLFLSNDIPTFKGLNYGLRRRIKIIPFYRTFKRHEQDMKLGKKLADELPGIVGWALEGAKRLVANEYAFTYSKSEDRALTQLEEEISSAIRFFNEYFEYQEDGEYSTILMYNEYREWCKLHNKKEMSSFQFNGDITRNKGEEFKPFRVRLGEDLPWARHARKKIIPLVENYDPAEIPF